MIYRVKCYLDDIEHNNKWKNKELYLNLCDKDKIKCRTSSFTELEMI